MVPFSFTTSKAVQLCKKSTPAPHVNLDIAVFSTPCSPPSITQATPSKHLTCGLIPFVAADESLREKLGQPLRHFQTRLERGVGLVPSRSVEIDSHKLVCLPDVASRGTRHACGGGRDRRGKHVRNKTNNLFNAKLNVSCDEEYCIRVGLRMAQWDITVLVHTIAVLVHTKAQGRIYLSVAVEPNCLCYTTSRGSIECE